MYTEDYLLAMIRRLAEAVGRWLRGESDAAEVEDALSGALGLSLATLDALPAAALLNVLRPGDDLSADRIEGVAAVLEALAELEGGPMAAARRNKAATLRAALPADTRGQPGGSS